MKKKKRCKICRKKLSKTKYTFCVKCGGLQKRKPERYICPECKNKKSFHAKRCAKCSHKYNSGKNHYRYKGRVKNSERYIDIYNPNHPLSNCRNYVPEHRLVMENYLRKTNPKSKFLIKINGELYLNPKYVIHHKNGKKDDNRIKNLEIKTKSQHPACHNEGPKNWNWKNGISKRKDYHKIIYQKNILYIRKYQRKWRRKQRKNPEFRKKEAEQKRKSLLKDKNKCKDCGKMIYNNSKRCFDCYLKSRKKN